MIFLALRRLRYAEKTTEEACSVKSHRAELASQGGDIKLIGIPVLDGWLACFCHTVIITIPVTPVICLLSRCL